MAQLSVIVVGGGVMGLAAGSALAGRGADVTVLERYAIAHEWASSHGLSRAIRHEYGPEVTYSRMVARSLALWDALAHESGQPLYTETGVLALGQPDDGHTLAGYEVMRAEGLPVERWTPEECEARFPAFRAREFDAITFNPRGGMLAASDCVRALAAQLQARGGAIREGVRVRSVEPRGVGGRVVLGDGTALDADRVIVTAGPWVHDVLGDLRLPVQATRSQVCYVAGLSPAEFAVGRFPVFLVGMTYYGFPLQGPGWFKVGWHGRGADADPNDPYPPDPAQVAEVREFLRRVIPAAAEAELALVDRCMYDMTPDEDFILDRHPGGPGVVIGSGFSGHGFKFAPVIGDLLASLALGAEPAFPLDPFRLARFATPAN
jgi:monomeric sarcosine oxidase